MKIIWTLIEGIEPVEILHKLSELKAPAQVFDLEDQLDSAPPEENAPNAKPQAKLLKMHIRRLIKHPLFESFSLTQQDVLVITDLWQFHLKLPGWSSSWEVICASAKIKGYQVTECLEYLTRLLVRNIICFDEKISGNYFLNPIILQSAEYTLSKDLILRILGRNINKDLALIMKENWQSNDDFLNDLRLVFDLCYNSFAELGSRSPVLEYPILSVCLNLLKARRLAAPDNLGIKVLVRQHGLSEDQLFIILVVFYHQLYRDDMITESDLVLSLAPDPRFRWLQQELLSDDSVLISSGLMSRELRFHRAQVSSLGIPHEILKSLGYRTRIADEVSIKLSSYFQSCQPTQTLDDLIIPTADKQLISQIITKCKSEKRRDMEKWGFKVECNKQGAVLLLYGAPGTGKTFTAGAIAKELQKDLICLSFSVVGELCILLLEGKDKQARQVSDWYYRIFGEDYYYEVQNHGLPSEAVAMNKLLNLAYQTKIPVVLTNDCHYMDRKDSSAIDALNCIRKGMDFSHPEAKRFACNEYYFKSPKEMKSLYDFPPQLIKNTLEIAD